MRTAFSNPCCPLWPGARCVLALVASLAFAFAAAAVDPPASAKYFDEITTRDQTYTRVTVLDVSKTHVYFRSAQGVATVRLTELDASVQARLKGGSIDAETAEASALPAKAMPVKADETSDPDEDAESSEAEECPPFEWTMASISGLSMIGLGCLVVVAGQIWMICAAFRVSTGWGIAVIFGTFLAGIVTSMFCRAHWDSAKRPVFLKMGGVALAVVGWILLPE